MSPALRVHKGEVLCYRVFDVGDEIALDTVERLCAEMDPRRATIALDTPDLLAFASPPVVITLGARTVSLPKLNKTVKAHMFAKLFDYGAISIRAEVAIPWGTDLGDLLPLCDELYDSPEVERVAREEVDKLVVRIADTINGKHDWRGAETYTVIFLTELDEKLSGRELLAWPHLAKLLIGEPRPQELSQMEVRDVLKHAHSYFEEDLVVIDWNSAIVLEPSGSRAVPEILEFATSQLLELRYYDGVFDKELLRIYDDLQGVRRWPLTVVRDPYSRLARAVVRRLVELTEFTERVDNALKLIGDFYIARVYQSAVRRFRIGNWQASIDGKQALVAQAYGLIRGEIESRRSTILEMIVILLILAELIAALRH